MGALFSSGSNQSISGLTRYLEASLDICQNISSSPGKVFVSGRGTSGTFGAENDSITLTADDFCQSEDGVDQTSEDESAGERFAQFTFLDTVIGNCDLNGEASTITMARGSGVLRNTDDFFPEIYGTFEIGEAISRCTLRLNNDGAIISEMSSCTAENGDAISLSSDLTCAMDADLERHDIELPLEGHMASISSEESNTLAYNCHEIYPLTQDSDGFIEVTSDCTSLNAFGFNLEALTFSVVVTGDENAWEFYELDGDISGVLNQAKILRINGYPVLLKLNLIYSADYDGFNPEVLDSQTEFPQALIDSQSFQLAMTTEIVDVANAAEHANIEMLAPLNEIDRIFAQSATPDAISTYLDDLMVELNTRYTGSLVAIARELSSDDVSTIDLEGFDYFGLSLSPLAESETFEAFQSYLGEQLSHLETIATAYNLPYFIAGAGITGDATNDGNVLDWNATSERVVDVFEEFYDRSQTFLASGIIFREGYPGDVIFSTYPDLQTYITGLFEPDNTETEVDGIYDSSLTPLTLTWDLLSGPMFLAKGMSMVGYDGKLYVFGGSSLGAGERTQIYDIANDVWTTGTNMPRYRESAVAAELNGLIYVIGGNDPETCSGNYRCAQLSSVDIYNPATNTWSSAGALNERRDVAGAVVYDDKIYVVGGMYSESGDTQVSNRDSLEMYDPDTNTWTIVNRDIPYPIRSAATVLAGDVIYVIGGCSEHGADLDELEAENTCTQTVVQIYDIGDASWSVLENNMPTGRHFSGQHAVALEEGVLVFGGSTDLGATTYSTVEALSFSSLTWIYATDMQARRKSSASTLYNNYLYVVGGTSHGENYSSELSDGMERADLSSL